MHVEIVPLPILLAVCCVANGWLLSADAPASEPLDIGSRRELFVDDWLIERLDGEAELRLQRPTPAEVVLVHDEPWEGNASAYHSVFQDGDRYRMFYRAWHLGSSGSQLVPSRENLCYAESDDGIHWRKPRLGLVEFNGSKENNIVLSTDMADGMNLRVGGPAVFRDENPNAPTEARYKTLMTSRDPLGLVPLASADGLHWKPLTPAPTITAGAFDSQNLMFWDGERGEYRAYWRIFTAGTTTAEVWKPDGIRAIRTAVSKDLVHWTGQADLVYPGSPPEQMYENGIAPCPRAPHIFIGLPVRYIDRANPGGASTDEPGVTEEQIEKWPPSLKALPDFAIRAAKAGLVQRFGAAITEGQFMASRDGVTFKRWNEAFLRPGPERPGTWNYGHQFIAWHPVETPSRIPEGPRELSLYSTEAYWSGGKGTSLRRYTLRQDGFVALSAPYAGGELRTKSLKFDGDALSLNFSTSAAGHVRVELRDARGRPIDGFTRDDCDELYGDTLDRLVSWRGRTDVSALSGQVVRVVFILRDADLYSFQFLSCLRRRGL